MKAGNEDGESNYAEYYPAWNSPTAINSIKNDAKSSAAPCNLAGQRVTDSYKGVVIKNGKKVVQ
jgi:hypothetical protein